MVCETMISNRIAQRRFALAITCDPTRPYDPFVRPYEPGISHDAENTDAISIPADTEGWEVKLIEAVSKATQKAQFLQLEARIKQLENQPFVVSTEIVSLAGSGYQLRTPIPVLISRLENPEVEEGEEYVAESAEANIAVTDSTSDRSINALKEALIRRFKFLTENETKLGKNPRRQLSVLRELISENE